MAYYLKLIIQFLGIIACSLDLLFSGDFICGLSAPNSPTIAHTVEVKPRSSTESPKTTPFPPTRTKDADAIADINASDADSAVDTIANTTDISNDTDAATDNDAKAGATADATAAAKEVEQVHDNEDKLTGIHILNYQP